MQSDSQISSILSGWEQSLFARWEQEQDDDPREDDGDSFDNEDRAYDNWVDEQFDA